MSKRKNKKIRDNTLEELELAKSKLNIRTYNALKNKITDKRIDAVKRISQELRDLNKIKTTGKKSLKSVRILIEENKAEKARVIQKGVKGRYGYIKLLKDFNATGNKTRFDNISNGKLLYILKNIDTTKPVIMRTALDKYQTITATRQKHLIENYEDMIYAIKEDAIGQGSDAEMIYGVIKVLHFVELTRPKLTKKSKLEGAYFKWYNNTDIDLQEFQVYNSKPDNYDENCFVQALIALDISTQIIQEVRSMICGKYIQTNQMTKIAEKYDFYIRVKCIDTYKVNKNDTKNYGKKTGKELLIGLIDQHYFAIKPVKWTMYSVKNYFTLKDSLDYHLIKDKEGKKDIQGKRFTNSYETIKWFYENKETYLRSIPHADLMESQYLKKTDVITDLNFSDSSVRSNSLPEEYSIEKFITVFFDFETFTNEILDTSINNKNYKEEIEQTCSHIPYMVSNNHTETEYGDDCGRKMLYALYNLYAKNSTEIITIVLLAHNASYDFRFIQEYLYIKKMIERGKNLLQMEGKFYVGHNKFMNVIVKDTYAVIPIALGQFGKTFQLSQEKEIIPYSLYTRKNVNIRFLKVCEVKPYCDKQVECNILDRNITEEDYTNYFDAFMINCSNWNCINAGLIDIIKYSKIYCEMDVKVLELGYTKFGDMLKEACNIDVNNCMSAAQLAHKFMLINNVFEGVNQLSSTPREYIMKCMVGGRTMCRDNKMWYIKKILADFDAVSLYPSAMKRLGGYLQGSPKVLENLSYEFLQQQDGYFVQIKVLSVEKEYSFPLMSYIENSVRNWTNAPTQNLYVCKIELEDLIEFHKIKFEIIDGYYYNEGRNNSLGHVIDFVFNERLKQKKKGNVLEQVYKLIMNSAYGKTLLKAFTDKTDFISCDKLDDFIDKNYNHIISYEKMHSSNQDFTRYKIKSEKTINSHFNNCACGIEVLAMSKRIMNEVMCLAEDIKIPIYYQDTDSLHIPNEDISKLADEYSKKYGRELIGKGMGQFHSDFSSKIIKGEVLSCESYFLGKKCYIDKLFGKDDNGNEVYDYHIRMKGVPNKSVLYKSVLEDKSLMDIYKSLYDYKKETFDLTCEGKKCCFKFNSNYTICSLFNFTRTLSFKSLRGDE